MKEELARGQCLCGQITFEASGEPLWVAYCHCQSCRRQTGSVVATFVGYRQAQIVYTRGQRSFYTSSPGVRRGFCSHCGTPLTYQGDNYPGELHLYLCTFDDPGRFKPQGHVYTSEKVPWFETADDLPRFATTSSGG